MVQSHSVSAIVGAAKRVQRAMRRMERLVMRTIVAVVWFVFEGGCLFVGISRTADD
jgi:hypothetical protein